MCSSSPLRLAALHGQVRLPDSCRLVPQPKLHGQSRCKLKLKGVVVPKTQHGDDRAGGRALPGEVPARRSTDCRHSGGPSTPLDAAALHGKARQPDQKQGWLCFTGKGGRRRRQTQGLKQFLDTNTPRVPGQNREVSGVLRFQSTSETSLCPCGRLRPVRRPQGRGLPGAAVRARKTVQRAQPHHSER